ncbi:MAG: TerB family tellurite resistance protein [Desulfobacterales bacterium]|nr:TerB family tellurite resistance protein [Desulfobacterales bacterium]
MGWMGKLVGGTLGFALGGPLGAVAGAVFGHAFDKNQEMEGGGRLPYLSSHEQANMTFFVAVFSMLAKVARADGHVSRAEIDTIERFMTEDLRLSPQSRNAAVGIFQTALDSPQTFEDFAGQFYEQFRFQPQILEFMLDILFRLSTADGRLTEEGESMIRSAARIFGIGEERYRRIRQGYASDVDSYYAVLGVAREDSAEEIKRAYRRLVQEYHPDKIAAKGLPEEFTRFAQDKFREIQEAYEKVKSDKGIR